MSEMDRLMTREIAAFTTMMKMVCLLVMTVPLLASPWAKRSHEILYVSLTTVALLLRCRWYRRYRSFSLTLYQLSRPLAMRHIAPQEAGATKATRQGGGVGVASTLSVPTSAWEARATKATR
jgi:hypothetical protein